MRSLSTHAAAAALGVDRKVLDNLLAREARSLIGPGRRGRSRRISVDLLERLAVALVLARDLGVGIAKGLELGGLIIRSPGTAVPVGSLGAFSFDLTTLRRALERSTRDALEEVAEPARGRPGS